MHSQQLVYRMGYEPSSYHRQVIDRLSFFVLKYRLSLFVLKDHLSLFMLKDRLSLFMLKDRLSLFVLKDRLSLFMLQAFNQILTYSLTLFKKQIFDFSVCSSDLS